MIEPITSEVLARDLTAVQLGAVQELRAQSIMPTLAIIEGCGQTALSNEVNTYVGRKLAYIRDTIGMQAVHERVHVPDMYDAIWRHNADRAVHGMIVEEPIPFGSVNPDSWQEHKLWAAHLLNQLHPAKSVDAQGTASHHAVGATAEATVRLLDHHGHTGVGKHVLIVGMGNVGGGAHSLYAERPVADLSSVDIHNAHELPRLAKAADMIVVATGKPGTLTPDMVRDGHVIAGVGARDIHPEVYELKDRRAKVTPRKGGVGPLTVRVLVGRTIEQARQSLAA